MGYLYGIAIEYLLVLAAWIGGGVYVFRQLLRARQRNRGKGWRETLVKLGLSTWLFLALLTGFEIYLAVFYDQTDSFNTTLTSKTWYRRHVDPYKNPEGFRDRRLLRKEPPEGVKVVWVMGDSFTYGHGVRRLEDRFSDRIADDFERQQPGRFLVYNVAEAGSHIVQAHNWAELFWSRGYTPPDVVVFVLCLNDIEPFLDGSHERYKKMGTWAPPWLILRESYLLNFLWFRLKQSQQADYRDYFGDLAGAFQGSAGSKLLDRVDRLNYTCRKNRVSLRLVIFPFLHNLGPQYQFAAAHDRIARHCRNVNIPVLDLRPVLEPHSGEGLTVNRFDAHPNERAHALAAEAIETQLLADLLTGKSDAEEK